MQLKEYLEKNGIKNSFFANKLGITHQLLLRYLNNYNRPSLELMFKIEKETGGKVPIKEWLSIQNSENNTGKKAKQSQEN